MTTTCAKCGTENVAGDAFCGNCGAFLEFAAEEAGEVGGAGGDSAVGSSAGTAAGSTAGADATAYDWPAGGGQVGEDTIRDDRASTDLAALAAGSAGPPTAATPTSAGATPPLAPAALTCGACGRANPAGRTFCISCGERLSVLAGVAGAGAAQAGAATPPAATQASPAWDFPTTAVPVVAPAAGAAAYEAPGGRSRLPLIAGIVIAAAVLGGGGLFVLAGGLGGGTPGSTASAIPTNVAASVPPSVGPSSEPSTPIATPVPTPPPTPPPTPTPVATIPPGPTVGIKITKAQASSQLSAQRAPKFLHDGSPATTWKSAGDAFEGAWVELTFAPAAVTRLQVWTGWQRDEPLFFGNHRPHNVTLSFDGGDPIPLELKDVLGPQRINIPPELGIVKATRLRITIADVFPARETTAGGSPTNQVAISEIRVFGVAVSP